MAERTERTVSESITCHSPSNPPDHEVIEMNKISCTVEEFVINVNIELCGTQSAI